jgi:hypothetical protein
MRFECTEPRNLHDLSPSAGIFDVVVDIRRFDKTRRLDASVKSRNARVARGKRGDSTGDVRLKASVPYTPLGSAVNANQDILHLKILCSLFFQAWFRPSSTRPKRYASRRPDTTGLGTN